MQLIVARWPFPKDAPSFPLIRPLKIGDDSVLFCCRPELKICEKLTQK
jgi:hypothetical protein